MQNVANHNVTRKIQYRHGMMRREDSLGVVTTPYYRRYRELRNEGVTSTPI